MNIYIYGYLDQTSLVLIKLNRCSLTSFLDRLHFSRSIYLDNSINPLTFLGIGYGTMLVYADYDLSRIILSFAF